MSFPLRQLRAGSTNPLGHWRERRKTQMLFRPMMIVTADHGELFGEEGYFGHGPIQHDKVFEVPYLEGMVP